MDALFKAGPDTLIALQRERPRAVGRQVPGARPAKGNPGAPPAATDDARDFLPIDGGVLVRSPGDGPREFFRVEFAGSTPALRELVNQLADFGLPLAVRSVEMEPLAPATVGRSRFVVTVELVGPTS